MKRIASSLMFAMLIAAMFLPEFAETPAAESMRTRAAEHHQEKSDELQEADRLNLEALKLHREGKHSEAIPLAERALAIQEKALGPDHKDVAVTLNILAGLYLNKKDHKKAESFYIRSLEVMEKAFGPDHIAVAQALTNLADFYFSRKKYKNAEPLYLRLLAIKEKSLGPDHPEITQTLNKLVELYLKKKDYERAESLFLRAAAIVEASPETKDAPGAVDSRPIPLNRPRPNYTERARKNGVQGVIRARVLVGIDGRVKAVRILRHLPDGLDSEAVRALLQLRFKPAIKNERIVMFWQVIDIEFNLK